MWSLKSGLAQLIMRGRCFCSTSNSSARLANKVCIITGGASGIGEATVRLFASHGAKVIIADIQDAMGERLASSVGDAAQYVHCNVTREEEVAGTVDEVMAKHGRLDFMFNNAGIWGSPTRGMTMKDLDIQDFERVMAINVKGMVLGTKHAARAMVASVPSKRREARCGSILCMSSVASVVGGVATHPYAISKSAVLGLVRSAASELRAHGISVNAISPIGIDTPLSLRCLQESLPNHAFTPDSLPSFIDQLAGFQGGRFSTMEVAKAALFFASDDGARLVSGLNFVLDGAFSVSKSFNL